MTPIYILGHKKPDTDSIMSAISLSYLKNQLGENTVAKTIGSINKETKFALKYFNIPEPGYLNDVKLQIKDINYHKNFYIKETDSIYNGYKSMLGMSLTGLPVVKDNGKLVGIVTIKDLSHIIINEKADYLYTSYNNILDVLKAEQLLKFDDEIYGKLLVASYRSTTFMETVKLKEDTILIVGDRHSIIEYAVKSKVKLIILSGDAQIKEEHLKIAEENKANIIRTKYSSYHITRLIVLANYIKIMIKSYNPIKFEYTDFVDNVIDINNKFKHTNYPIVDRKNKCLGALKVTDLSDKHPKKVILVDHNEKMQSVEGLEEAEIVEIIDHHNLGNITTSTPINFRNMAVGSTCTIVYTLFKEREVAIPSHIAGALISGILSDTMILKSPTATKKDVEAVEELSKIANVNYKDYGLELLKAGTSLEGMSKEDVLYNDFKLYTAKDKSFGIGQFFTMNFNDIKKDLAEYVETLNRVAKINNYSLVALYVTDIIKNGSYVIYNDGGRDVLEIAYDNNSLKEGDFIPGCVSRKKHIVPIIMPIFEN